MRKKKWATPLLTVLVKGKPDENLLSSCKRNSVGWNGAGVKQDGCVVFTCVGALCNANTNS